MGNMDRRFLHILLLVLFLVGGCSGAEPAGLVLDGIPVVDMLFDTQEQFYQAVMEKAYADLMQLTGTSAIHMDFSVDGDFVTPETAGLEIDGVMYHSSGVMLNGETLHFALYVHNDDTGKFPKRGSPIGQEDSVRLWVQILWKDAPWLGENDTARSIDMTIHYLIRTEIAYLQTGVPDNTQKYRAVGYIARKIKEAYISADDYSLVHDAQYTMNSEKYQYKDAITSLEQALFEDLRMQLEILMRESGLPKQEYRMGITADLASRGMLSEVSASWIGYDGTIILRDKELDESRPVPPPGLENRFYLEDWFLAYSYRFDEEIDAYVFDHFRVIDSSPYADLSTPWHTQLNGTEFLPAGGFMHAMQWYPSRYADQDFAFE